MTQAEKEYTWDDLRNAVGQDFSDGDVRSSADPVERGTIRLFCEPFEMDCPLHYDDEAARAWGYRGVIAPWSSLSSVFSTPPLWRPGEPSLWKSATSEQQGWGNGLNRPPMPKLPMPKTTVGMATGLEFEFFLPVYVGDRLHQKGRKLVDVAVAQTRVGFGAFVTFESGIYNQDDALVALQRVVLFHGNPPQEAQRPPA